MMQLSEMAQMPGKNVRQDSVAPQPLLCLYIISIFKLDFLWEMFPLRLAIILYVILLTVLPLFGHGYINSSLWRSPNLLTRVTCKWNVSSCLTVPSPHIDLTSFSMLFLYRWMNLKVVKRLVETDEKNVENYPLSKV